MSIEHLSFSSISSYLYCPKAWKYKYVDKIPTKTTPALLFGSAWHKTIEQALKDGNPPKGNYFVEILNEEIKIAASRNQEIIWGEDSLVTLQNTGQRFITSDSIIEGLSMITPARDEGGFKIEQKVELNVPGVPLPVIGYIDIITEDGVCGDFKTSGKSWTNVQAEDSLQPLFYLAALKQAGANPQMKFRHFVFVKTKEPKFQIVETNYKAKNFLFLYSLILNIWRSIENQSFFENPSSWKCSAAHCDFWDICRGKFQ